MRYLFVRDMDDASLQVAYLEEDLCLDQAAERQQEGEQTQAARVPHLSPLSASLICDRRVRVVVPSGLDGGLYIGPPLPPRRHGGRSRGGAAMSPHKCDVDMDRGPRRSRVERKRTPRDAAAWCC
jgi:hypothetical protein